MSRPLFSRIARPLAVMALLAAGACAPGPQRVVLFPGAEAPAGVGQGRTVALVVQDQVVAPKAGPGEVPGMIVSDSAAVVRATLEGALAQAGFVTAPVDSPRLTVVLHELSYTTPTTVLKGTVRAQVAVEAIATGAGGTFRRTYKVFQEREIALVPFARKDGTLLNQALSEVLGRMLADPEVLAALGAAPPR
ncbi:MAG: hypothetical protein HZA24_09700 [Nitrospirae bacterium]|nr:hypothetical protein [Nitrospirota bacterium]